MIAFLELAAVIAASGVAMYGMDALDRWEHRNDMAPVADLSGKARREIARRKEWGEGR